MSFELNISNKLNPFVDKIELRAKSLFNPQYIVFQNSGVKDLLTMQLTKKYGVIANLNFIGFNELALAMADRLGIKTHASGQMDWLWAVYYNLGQKSYIEAFPSIYNYYQTDYYKRIQLAEQLADLFEHYMVYRSEMVDSWKNKKLQTSHKEIETWQRELFLLCLEKLESERVNRVYLKEDIINDVLSDHTDKSWIAKHFPIIQVFGVDVLLPADYKLLAALGKYTDVKLYMFNPSPNTYWYDCVSNKDQVRRKFKQLDNEFEAGNDLLLSNGKMGRDMFSFMFDEYPEVLNTTYEFEVAPKENLLGILQYEILNNTNKESRATYLPVDDGSLKVVGNYTEAREVEVLMDFILKSLNENKDLQLQDILVMAPDIEKYKPYIEAVLENNKYGKYIKYTVSDLPFSSTEVLVKLLIDLLQLRAEDITQEKVLKLLENPLVKSKFEIYDLEKIHFALSKTCFVFGEKGVKEDETHLISWEQSKKQLMYGIVMSHQDIELDDFTVPTYEENEGASSQETIRLVAFIDLLFDYAQQNSKRNNIEDWGSLFLNRVEDFWVDKLIEPEALQVIQDTVELLDKSSSSVEDQFNSMTYSYLVSKKLMASESISEKQGGRIMFSNMQSMKGLEHKVIAVLGLNEKDFPRIPTKLSFDLMSLSPKKADRSLKDNDKYLFLEALMCASEKFYCSYLSRRVKDNKQMNPSIVIQEILDYIQEVTGEVDFIEQHPKESDSLLYYLKDSSLFSYNALPTYENPYVPVLKNQQSIENHDSHLILWEDVVAYFKNPQKWYVRNVLGLYLDEKSDEVPASESFGDYNPGLEEYLLKKQLFDEVDETVLKRSLTLPLHNFGEVIADTKNKELSSLRERVKVHQVLSREVDLGDVSLELENGKLIHLQSKVNKEKNTDTYLLVEVSLSKATSTGKYLFNLWMRYVWLKAQGKSVVGKLEAIEDKGCVELTDDLIDQNKAMEILNSMIKVYQKRYESFIPFYPKISYNLKDHLQTEDFETRLKKELDKNQYDLDLNLSLSNDVKDEVWSAENVKSMISKIWPI